MAITTYAQLQTAAANWLDRTDLSARIPEFIEYLKNDERLAMWSARLDKALTDLRLQGQRERHTASGLRMRSRVLG